MEYIGKGLGTLAVWAGVAGIFWLSSDYVAAFTTIGKGLMIVGSFVVALVGTMIIWDDSDET